MGTRGTKRAEVTGVTRRADNRKRGVVRESLNKDAVFQSLLKQRNLPRPTMEHRFCERRWRFDYAWVPQKLALEVEGGIWIRGRHSRGAGMLADMEKYNRAQLEGWIVLRTVPTGLWLEETLANIERALKERAA